MILTLEQLSELKTWMESGNSIAGWNNHNNTQGLSYESIMEQMTAVYGSESAEALSNLFFVNRYIQNTNFSTNSILNKLKTLEDVVKLEALFQHFLLELESRKSELV
jgi:hypothetical protein